MKPTVRNDTTETRTPSIEKTLYGPPQHSTRRTESDGTFYGPPQHETDVDVNVEPREANSSFFAVTVDDRKYSVRSHFVSGRPMEATYP